MAKQTVLDKAIADIEKDIAVLQAAKQRLVTQQATTKKAIRKPRVVNTVPLVQERPR